MVTEVDVSNPTGVLMPGLYAEVSLESRQHGDVLATPVEAIERAGSATRVYAIDTSGTVRIVTVQLGVEDAHRAQVLSGLAEDDLVITGRRTGLKAGDKVRAKVAVSAQ
jgi:hypothetical protein